MSDLIYRETEGSDPVSLHSRLSVMLITAFFGELMTAINQSLPVEPALSMLSCHGGFERHSAPFMLPSRSRCNQTANYKVVLLLI